MKTIFFNILIFVCFHTIQAQKFHAIILADTTDASIGKSCIVDMNNMNYTVKYISTMIDYECNIIRLCGNKFSMDEVDKFLANFQCMPYDIVLFYYSGHGFNQAEETSEYPFLYLKDKGYSLEKIHRELKKKKARFTMVVTDCCNSLVDIPIYVNKNIEFASQEIKESNYRKLFLKFKGDIILSSTKKGEWAFGSNTKGGYFTSFFIETIEDVVNSNSNLSWDYIIKKTKMNLAEIRYKDFKQNPVYRITYQVNENKVNQPVNIELANKYLNQFIHSKENLQTIKNTYDLYFDKNALVFVYKDSLFQKSLIIEKYIEHVILNKAGMKEIKIIPEKSIFNVDGLTLKEVFVNENY